MDNSVKRALICGICVSGGLAAQATPAHAQTPNPVLTQALAFVPRPATAIPNHLEVGNQTFEASVNGLRAYVESIKVAQPRLYAQLAPDVERLESQRASAWAVLATGLVVGVASTIYAFASKSTCQDPSIYDPNFAAKVMAWGSCNEDNFNREATYVLVGFGAATLGALSALAMSPSRSDILDVLNKNNRLSPEPLRLQLGYDPSHQLAFAGAALTF
jgi:hypothetical protein